MSSRNGILNDNELKNWKPKVILQRLTKQEIASLSDDWSFLDNVYIVSEIRLHCDVIAKHLSLDGKLLFLLRWSNHRDIFRYEWTTSLSVPSTKTIDIQNLYWNEKLLLSPFYKH